MRDKLKISIALCTYNGQQFLEEQLDSFLRQSRLPDELIVSDDASQDRTMEILQDFQQHAPFVVHIQSNPENLGISRNFNAAITRTSGDIIFLSDQDDVWHPEKIATMVACFSDERIGLVYSDGILVDDKRNPSGKTMWQTLSDMPKYDDSATMFSRLLQGNYITGAMLAFRRELKPIILPLSDYIIHDYWIALLASLTYQVARLERPLIEYRQHSTNQIGLRHAHPFLQRVQKALSIPSEQYYEAYLGLYDLAQRIDTQQIQLTSEQRNHLDEQIAHWYVRAKLPINPLKRLPIIFREVFDARYQKYSRNGLASALRDLFIYPIQCRD